MTKRQHTFRFDEERHLYYIDERLVPGVTGILTKVYGDPYKNVGEEARDYALRLGREVHAWTALNDKRLLVAEPGTEMMKGYLAGWRLFLKERVTEIIDVERQVYSLKLRFAGTLDRVLMMRDPSFSGKILRALVDLKSGKAIHPFAELQTELYALAWEEMNYPLKIQHRATILVNQEGKYAIEHHMDKTDRQTALATLTCLAWRSSHNLKIEVDAA